MQEIGSCVLSTPYQKQANDPDCSAKMCAIWGCRPWAYQPERLLRGYDKPFAKGAAVTLTITKDNLFFKTQAKAVYSNVGMGMGLLFTPVEPDHLQVLGNWLSELSGEIVSEPPALNSIVQPKATNGTDPELRKIFGELVALLNGKSILNDSEGMALLRKLSK
jgi:hypothetical protein